jgi:hypothetical protein
VSQALVVSEYPTMIANGRRVFRRLDGWPVFSERLSRSIDALDLSICGPR